MASTFHEKLAEMMHEQRAATQKLVAAGFTEEQATKIVEVCRELDTELLRRLKPVFEQLQQQLNEPRD